MPKSIPDPIKRFQKNYPQVWDAFTALGSACHDAEGPLDEKARRLVKVALAIGARHEGAVHSATRRTKESGVSAEEIRQVAVLAITTIGWPASLAAMTWIDDELLPLEKKKKKKN
jgi:alkylhydroperoxidase/carboxymuconolactone decarboxylase family protein YurZ